MTPCLTLNQLKIVALQLYHFNPGAFGKRRVCFCLDGSLQSAKDLKETPNQQPNKSENRDGCVLISVTKKVMKHAWYKKKHVIELQRCKFVLLKTHR